MNSVYIDSAVASSPIYLGPNNASSVIIGNTNCTTFVNGLPINNNIGPTLVGYNISTASNANKPTGIEIASLVETNTTLGGKAYIDFHTNQMGFVDYDARIIAAGGSTGTATAQQASLNYYAASHYFDGPINMGTGSNIQLQPTSGYIPPTAGTMIGGITQGTIVTTGGTNSYQVGTITIPTTGIYHIFWVFQMNTTTNPTAGYVQLYSTSTAVFSPTIGPNFPLGYPLTTTAMGCNGSFITRVTTAGTLVLQLMFSGTVNSTSGGNFIATRIA